MSAVAVIPARYDSRRFPGKVLADETGKPLLQHVHERTAEATRVDRIIVATDDERIRAAVEAFGGEVAMTRPDHPNGTSRIAEVAANIEADVLVNVQGDEPEIDPGLIDMAIATLEQHPDCPMATIASPFAPGEDPADPNLVKVVIDQGGCALYFSRALIPHLRDGNEGATPLKHLGLYVYRRAFLATYQQLPPTPLEQTERLEQLRALEHGHRIAVAVGAAHHHGIDTPEQYAAFVRRYRASCEMGKT